MARTRVSFATCNLYNFNLPGLSIYTDSDGWDQIIYDHKVAWTAGVITTMSADVWGFQELWHHQAHKNDHLNRDGHKEPGTSDHGVVRAEFEYRPY